MLSRALAGLTTAVVVMVALLVPSTNSGADVATSAPDPTPTTTLDLGQPEPDASAPTTTVGITSINGPAEIVETVDLPAVAVRSLEDLVAEWCFLHYCHADPNVERWHLPAVEAGLVDLDAVYGARSWRLWGPIIARESGGNPRVAPTYRCCKPKGLTQLVGWAGVCVRAGVITHGAALTDPAGLPNLRCAAHIRDVAGIDEWRGNICSAKKRAYCDFPSWTREVLPS